MGSGLSGFLSGFLQTHLALQEHDDRRQQEQQKIALLKERLGLQRDLLKGRQAHLKLQDELTAGRLELLLRRYGRQLAGGGPLPLGAAPLGAPATDTAGARPPNAPDGAEVLPEVVPNIVDPSQPAALVSPLASPAAAPASPAVTPLQQLSPQQIWEASDEVIAGLKNPEDLEGLSAPQLQALRLRLARRQPLQR